MLLQPLGCFGSGIGRTEQERRHALRLRTICDSLENSLSPVIVSFVQGFLPPVCYARLILRLLLATIYMPPA
jgi:hypothetical protein